MPLEQGDMELADRQAESILRSALSPGQLSQYVNLGYFEVKVPVPGPLYPPYPLSLIAPVPLGYRVYRIRRTNSYNVRLLQGDAEVRAFCAAPAEGMPFAYMMLSQLLMLQTNEAQFLKIANVNHMMQPG
jgi:hypothetical protein